MGPRSPFVHELLRFLEAAGFEGAPRMLGVDGEGREILSFVEGRVPHAEDGRRLSDAHLENAAALIRRFHDATAGSPLAAGYEIVAHNELGPHNTVFVGDRPAAFIDWDDAAPGTRLFDLSNAVWSFADVGEEGGLVKEQARRVRLMCDAYGWEDPCGVVEEIHADWRRALANHERARRQGPARVFREMVRWISTHAEELEYRATREPARRAEP